MFCKSRARKKKGLTDLVEIIPFPNQNLRDKVRKKPASTQKQPPLEKVNYQQKPQPKVLNSPSGNIRSSSLSIKKMLAPKEVNEDGQQINRRDLPLEHYGFDDLKMAWRRFAHQVKEKGEKTFYNALIKRDPIPQDDNMYIMELDNQVQLDSITNKISDLLEYLRSELRNYSINVKMELSTKEEEEVKYKTGKDKFASMARKNPNLHTLKKTFNLDIEF